MLQLLPAAPGVVPQPHAFPPPALGFGRNPQKFKQRERAPGVLKAKAVSAPQKTGSGVEAAKQPLLVYEGTGANVASNGKPANPRIVILGTGWGAVSVLRSLPKKIVDQYEITVVSPRNYFLFTALLPAVATGNLEERSVTEPIRRILAGKGKFFEANAEDIDPKNKMLTVRPPRHRGLSRDAFKISYDTLILAIGSVNNTFGIKGVEQHSIPFKRIEDARALRQRVSECFEHAALPGTSDQARRDLLSFIVVGGGPTGVEVAAELYDLIKEDLSRFYPQLAKDVARVRLVELQDHILSTYDREISDYAAQLFSRNGIDLVLNCKVTSISKGSVQITYNDGNTVDYPFGACVWATGVAKNPLVTKLQERLPETQRHFRSILTDDYLQVLGSNGSIFAIGDAATIDQPKARQHAARLFVDADINKDGTLELSELRLILKKASAEFSHLEEHATFLEGQQGAKRFGGLVRDTLTGNRSQHDASKGMPTAAAGIGEDARLTQEEFADLLGRIDDGLRALPATGQVAGQQGAYLANLLRTGSMGYELAPSVKPFRYRHGGTVAYVGSDQAVMELPTWGNLKGYSAGFLWRGWETYRQISFRNQCLVAFDWLKTKVFGRDLDLGRSAEEPST
ncbi:hypothetical protein WJX74_008426 [Apatococcus lobatus]|uniref:NADH:ubiquinone reductase (non-electrogenic) n=1 Tax=Apatococcus lobatus TaxID=904363 RepID=A0AAW1RSH2_9CHLO